MSLAYLKVSLLNPMLHALPGLLEICEQGLYVGFQGLLLVAILNILAVEVIAILLVAPFLQHRLAPLM